MIKTKSFVLLSSITCFAAFGLIFAASSNFAQTKALRSLLDRTPYVRSLVIDASNFQNGSGTFTLEGNHFSYDGVTVNGDDISFAANGYLRTVEDSGATSGSELTGAGFTTLGASMTANFNGNVVLNNQTSSLDLTAGNTHSFAVNKKSMNLVFEDAGFKVNQFIVSYKCQSVNIAIDGKADDYIWSSEVMSNFETVNLNNDYKTEVYCFKNTDGIYVYAEQHVAVVKNAGDGWWQKDNLEFHIDSGTAYRNYNFDTTKQYFVSMNGGTTFDNFAHSEPSLNPDTNLYDINYEAFVSWSTLGLLYEDLQIVVIGSNYNGGFTWNHDIGYHSERSHKYPIMTNSGFRPWSLDHLTGSELISNPIHGSADDSWNYRLANARISTGSNFILKISEHAENGPSHLNDLATGFVGEFVSSNGWGEGGCSFRKDWNGWGGFAPDTGTNPNKFDVDDISTLPWGEGGGAAFEVASNAMDFQVVYSFRGSNIDMMMLGTSTVEDYVGKTYYASMRFKDVSALANIDIGIGYNLGSATVTSYQAVVGSPTLL